MVSVSRRVQVRERRTALLVLVLLVVGVVLLLTRGSGHPPLPKPGNVAPPRPGDPFAYVPAHQAQFVARAVAGESHVLFALSPGGALGTAARVAAFRPEIEAAAAGTGVNPNLLEGIVFLESAGRPDAIAGGDPASASGLTQILASTGQTLLGMHINLAASRALTIQIAAAQAAGRTGAVARLEIRRQKADDRFVPAKALRATVRYLRLAEARFRRWDLAVESYHMGMGNLTNVLSAYDNGGTVPYAQLYFDTAPDHHAGAFRLLASFGDDSSTYLWRVYAAMEIMRLYRHDLAELTQIAALQYGAPSAALVLHPPSHTHSFRDPDALWSAYGDRTLVPLPANAAELGLAYNRQLGWLASRLHVPRALYRGLRPAALELLVELAARVRALSGVGPLVLESAVIDGKYAGALGTDFPGATSGYSFEIARRYVDTAQTAAFQAMLDRLQALNLIAWDRTQATIDITVASDAPQVIAHGV